MMGRSHWETAEEIKHLSAEEIENLYERYLAGEKNASLVEEYNININPNMLISKLPLKKLEDRLCPYCETPMFAKRKSKNQGRLYTPPNICYECGHKESNSSSFYESLCLCNECENIREQDEIKALKERTRLIRKKYCVDERKPIDYSKLVFFQKLVLFSLLKMQGGSDFRYILSIRESSKFGSLSPTQKMDIECLNDLFNSGVLLVDPDSGIDAFSEEDNFNSFNVTKVSWTPNVTVDGTTRSTLQKLYSLLYNELSGGIKNHWEIDIFNTLYSIAREEVIQYVHIKADELNIKFTAEDKTRQVINQLLANFSVSEIYYFSKKAVENAHIFYSKGLAKNKQHAANTIPGKMQSLGEKALNEDWNTYKFNRDPRAPRSMLSLIFYDFILEDIDSGFKKAPGLHWADELYIEYFCDRFDAEKNQLKCNDCRSTELEVKMLDSVLQVNCKLCGSTSDFVPTR